MKNYFPLVALLALVSCQSPSPSESSPEVIDDLPAVEESQPIADSANVPTEGIAPGKEHFDRHALTLELMQTLTPGEIIFAEAAVSGAMGNAGGIVIHRMEEGELVRYSTNIFTDEPAYLKAWKMLFKHQDRYFYDGKEEGEVLFEYHYGGMGNHVLLNRAASFRLEDNHLVYEGKSREHRIDCTVRGVFNNLVKSLNSNGFNGQSMKSAS